MEKKNGHQGHSPCVGCDHNTNLSGRIRHDGKVQCCLNEDGNRLPLRINGYQSHALREPLPPGSCCVLSRLRKILLIIEAREARLKAVAAQRPYLRIAAQ